MLFAHCGAGVPGSGSLIAGEAEAAWADASALGGLGVQDALASLEASLRPVERYAVRFLEETAGVDIERAAMAKVEAVRPEDWQLEELERRKEEQVGHAIVLDVLGSILPSAVYLCACCCTT